MDYKKIKNFHDATTRNLDDFTNKTGNIYKTVAILAKRANQINLMIKEEINEEVKSLSSQIDSLEETFENIEQIKMSKIYEEMPKPSLLATYEWLHDKIYYEEKKEEEEQLY